MGRPGREAHVTARRWSDRACARLEPGHLSVDRGRCEGYGMCEQAAPELLHLDDDDELVIDMAEISLTQKPLADAAVRACPVAALNVCTTSAPA
ncbi:ferredoxin [Streptomyces sp. SD11]|uniref:ferredoxin n=1 Tax=Streptomyces sp. SD11 TaxID=3452209 RepID=UPI003F8CA2F8